MRINLNPKEGMSMAVGEVPGVLGPDRTTRGEEV